MENHISHRGTEASEDDSIVMMQESLKSLPHSGSPDENSSRLKESLLEAKISPLVVAPNRFSYSFEAIPSSQLLSPSLSALRALVNEESGREILKF